MSKINIYRITDRASANHTQSLQAVAHEVKRLVNADAVGVCYNRNSFTLHFNNTPVEIKVISAETGSRFAILHSDINHNCPFTLIVTPVTPHKNGRWGRKRVWKMRLVPTTNLKALSNMHKECTSLNPMCPTDGNCFPVDMYNDWALNGNNQIWLGTYTLDDDTYARLDLPIMIMGKRQKRLFNDWIRTLLGSKGDTIAIDDSVSINSSPTPQITQRTIRPLSIDD